MRELESHQSKAFIEEGANNTRAWKNVLLTSIQDIDFSAMQVGLKLSSLNGEATTPTWESILRIKILNTNTAFKLP